MRAKRGAGSATRALLTAWIALSIVGASVSLFAGNAAAQTLVADSVGEVGLFGFITWYDFILTASDCIQTRLLLNSVVQLAFDYGCGSTGARAFDALFAPLGVGRYTLEISSTSTNELLYTHSWNVPAISMTASVTPTSANTGDSVVMTATFRLIPGGPDSYTTRGTLTVDAGSVYTQDVTLTLLSARDLNFWVGEPTSAYETFTVTLPVSFGTAGTRSVSIVYQDEAHSFIETRSVQVSDPTQDDIAALQDEIRRLRSDLSASGVGGSGTLLTIVAMVLGLLGIVVGFLGITTARRALRAIAPPPARPSAPPPMATAWPPPSPPPAPPAAPPGSPPSPPPSPPSEPGPPQEPPPPGA